MAVEAELARLRAENARLLKLPADTLDQMTEDAGEAGIYGGTPEDYAAALKKARRRAARREDAPRDAAPPSGQSATAPAR